MLRLQDNRAPVDLTTEGARAEYPGVVTVLDRAAELRLRGAA